METPGSRRDTGPVSQEMLEDCLALIFLNQKQNLFLATLALVLRIVSGQHGETGSHAIETMDVEIR